MKKVLLASAARTATTASEDVTHADVIGGHFIVDVTAAGTGTLTVTVQGKDPISGNYYTILASAALAATGTTPLRVFPGATAAANTVANDALPHTFRVNAAKSDGSSWTFSVSFSGRMVR